MKKTTFISYRKRFILCHPWLSFLLLLTILCSSLSSLLPPLILRQRIDNVFLSSLSKQDHLLLFSSLTYFLSYLLISLFDILNSVLIDYFGSKLIYSLRLDRRKKRHVLPASYFRRNGSGRISSRIRDDVSSLESLFSDGLISLLVSLLKIISILVSVFLFSYLLGLLLLVSIPLVFLLTMFFRKRRLLEQLAVRKKENRIANGLSESLSSFQTLENLNKEEYAKENLDSLLVDNRKLRDRSAIYDALFSPLVRLLRAIRIAIVTFLVVSFKDTSSLFGLSVGTFAASLTMISNLFAPIQELGQEIQVRQEGTSGAKRARDFLNLPERKKFSGKRNPLLLDASLPPVIEAKNLSFSYQDGKEPVFSSSSFVLQGKERVLLLGRTGAGKTTLFRMLLGREYPTHGSLTLNGQDIFDLDDNRKKKVFGYVTQGFLSVPGTILDQITLHDKSVSLSEARKARQECFLDEYVRKEIDGGYSAHFDSSLFSQGQLELLSLARALVHNPKILLLDELSSSIDTLTEKRLLSALDKAGKGRRRISITHRYSSLLAFNRALRIEEGKIKEVDITSLSLAQGKEL